jgi:hypothetical protein
MGILLFAVELSPSSPSPLYPQHSTPHGVSAQAELLPTDIPRMSFAGRGTCTGTRLFVSNVLP